MTDSPTVCHYFGLSETQKELITKACSGAPWVELAPLDKGLSGSLALMARWSVSGAPSKFHVFKIGNAGKLKREYEAITNVAAPMMQDFPHCAIYYSNDRSTALLSQEFVGDNDGSTKSLRQHIEKSSDENEVASVIANLYDLKLLHWKPNVETESRQVMTLQDALKAWIRKGDLDVAAARIGQEALNRSLVSQSFPDVDHLKTLIRRIFRSNIHIDVGPVHGDLHSQNVIVGRSGKISLIDFGWTAIRWRAVDYLWLECSLKFVVASSHTTVDDLLKMEDILDKAWEAEGPVDLSQLDGRMLSADLRKITIGIAKIREEARSRLPRLTLSDYRRGLLGMAYSLTTFPELNLVHLMHSIARNAVLAESDVDDEGPYHELYAGAETLLWPGRAGRMVRKAVERLPSPGLALDIGCGDGKDIVFLEDHGWTATGIDIASRAIDGTKRRIAEHFGSGHSSLANISRFDAVRYDYPDAQYDLVVAYGLYHCLDDEALAIVHRGAVRALKSGGLFAFATFNDLLPIPDGHRTGDLILRPADHIFQITNGDFELLDSQIGEISEEHYPMVAKHKHSLTWALLKKL